MKYKLGARRLERIIEQVYGIHIPHNRIHKFLLEEGLAKEEPRKKRRKKPYIMKERIRCQLLILTSVRME